MSLSQVQCGKTVSIVCVNASEQYIQQLAMLGIFPGAPVQVLDNSLRNAAVINCRGARLALGRGLPNHIEVAE